jgi:hypothetical protein
MNTENEIPSKQSIRGTGSGQGVDAELLMEVHQGVKTRSETFGNDASAASAVRCNMADSETDVVEWVADCATRTRKERNALENEVRQFSAENQPVRIKVRYVSTPFPLQAYLTNGTKLCMNSSSCEYGEIADDLAATQEVDRQLERLAKFEKEQLKKVQFSFYPKGCV